MPLDAEGNRNQNPPIMMNGYSVGAAEVCIINRKGSIIKNSKVFLLKRDQLGIV